jgi:ADP-heptose:LPS heptosyltransferase
MSSEMINYSCRNYRSSKPCKYNKLYGSECPTCGYVSEFKTRVLIVKLDALGDVLRTGSFVPIIAARHQSPFIAWLTRPEAVQIVSMMQGVDEVIPLSVDGLPRISTGGWDYVYSLSNDLTSASLATMAAPAHPPIGYSLQGGILKPSNAAAERWLRMASFDRLKRENTQSYQKIMLDIIGAEGSVAPPILNADEDMVMRAAANVSALFPGSKRPRVAVNIGSGDRWPKKMLDAEQIANYAKAAGAQLDVDVLLVGGSAEVSKAERILSICAGEPSVRAAITTHSVPEFVAVLKQANALLCGDTLALHIAAAIGLPSVCVVGPTSSAELADFDGLIVKTSVSGLDCLGCYADCKKIDNCMSLFDFDDLIDLTRQQLMRGRPSVVPVT